MLRQVRDTSLAALSIVAFFAFMWLVGDAVRREGVFTPAEAQANGPTYVCNSSVIYDTTTNGSTLLVASAGTSRIFICGYVFGTGSTATNVKLTYGTTVTNPCDTGTKSLTPAWELAANQTVADHGEAFNSGLIVPAGNNACINTSAGNAVQAIVYYTQF